MLCWNIFKCHTNSFVNDRSVSGSLKSKVWPFWALSSVYAPFSVCLFTPQRLGQKEKAKMATPSLSASKLEQAVWLTMYDRCCIMHGSVSAERQTQEEAFLGVSQHSAETSEAGS